MFPSLLRVCVSVLFSCPDTYLLHRLCVHCIPILGLHLYWFYNPAASHYSRTSQTQLQRQTSRHHRELSAPAHRCLTNQSCYVRACAPRPVKYDSGPGMVSHPCRCSHSVSNNQLLFSSCHLSLEHKALAQLA